MLDTVEEEKNKITSDILHWTPTHGHTNVGQPAKTYIHQSCARTGYCREIFPRAMINRD